MFILISVLFLILSSSLAHGHSVITHQHFAFEAINVLENPSDELKRYIDPKNIGKFDRVSAGCLLKGSCANYDLGDEVVIGSAEEDFSVIIDRKNNVHALSVAEHFWNPNLRDSGNQFDVGATFRSPLISFGSCLTYGGAYQRAEELYSLALLLYSLGDYEQSYYTIGRVAHLLTDLTVPAHVHNDIHTGFLRSFIIAHCEGGGPSAEDDAYEDYMGKKENIVRFIIGEGHNLKGKQYDVENLPNIPSNFDWSKVLKKVTSLGKLFWYVAQKTQSYASDGDIINPNFAHGDNGLYIMLDGSQGKFSPSLWSGEVDDGEIISNPRDIESLRGKDNKTNLSKMAAVLAPHTLKAVAGLYKLFWEETHGNQAPEIASLTANPSSVYFYIGACAVTEERQSVISVSASDPDADQLTYSWSASIGSLSATSGADDKIWTAPSGSGDALITVTVTDSFGASVSRSVTINYASEGCISEQ